MNFFDSSVFELGAEHLAALLPYLLLCLGIAICCVLAAKKAPIGLMRTVLIATLGSFASLLLIGLRQPAVEVFGTALEVDVVTRLVGAGVALLALLCTFFTRSSDEGSPTEWGPLLLLSCLGLSLLPAARDWVSFFVFLETLAISGYVLTAIDTHRERSLEAGLKYLLMGSFASALFLMGATLLYGLAGSFDYDRIREILQNLGPNQRSFAVTGALLIVASLAFKVALFPFHMWAPDVYQSAPTGLAAFLASATKLSVFASLAVSATMCQFFTLEPVQALLTALSFASIIFGSIMAVAQSKLRRMLAYGSIVSAGYAALAVIAGPSAYGSLLLYLFVYGIALICAFAICEVFAVAGNQESHDDVNIQDLSKISAHVPAWLSALFAIAILSMAGIPPLPGFLTKYAILKELWVGGRYSSAVLLVTGSFLGLAYYLRLLVPIYLDRSHVEKSVFKNGFQRGILYSATFAGTLAMLLLLVSLGGFSRFFQWMSLAEGFAR